jgi:hypothetical protein
VFPPKEKPPPVLAGAGVDGVEPKLKAMLLLLPVPVLVLKSVLIDDMLPVAIAPRLSAGIRADQDHSRRKYWWLIDKQQNNNHATKTLSCFLSIQETI